MCFAHCPGRIIKHVVFCALMAGLPFFKPAFFCLLFLGYFSIAFVIKPEYGFASLYICHSLLSCAGLWGILRIVLGGENATFIRIC